MTNLYFIAEMSSNHLGDLERAKDIIRLAASAGANAIKLQTYKPEHLTIDCDSPNFVLHEGLWMGQKLYDLYHEAQTPWGWHAELKTFAEDHGLDFIGTPFHVEAVEFLQSIGCELYKVSNLAIDDLELMKAVADTGKETFISYDPTSDKQRLERAMQFFDDCQANILLTTNEYPCELIDSPHDKFDVFDKLDCFNKVKAYGLSDHCNDAIAPLIACMDGATIFEKHFTLDKTDAGFDESFSITPKEFKELIGAIKSLETELFILNEAMPKPPKNVNGGRQDVNIFCRGLADRVAKLMDTVKRNAGMRGKFKQKYNLSLYTVEDIKSGDPLTKGNIRMIRGASQGLPPKFMPKVLGKKARRPLERGTPLGEGDYC